MRKIFSMLFMLFFFANLLPSYSQRGSDPIANPEPDPGASLPKVTISIDKSIK
jgi:hypothetical protein